MATKEQNDRGLEVRRVVGMMGNGADLIVETRNSVYFIDSRSEKKWKHGDDGHTLTWETDAQGRITGAVETWLNKVRFNGRYTEELVGRWGDSKALVALWG